MWKEPSSSCHLPSEPGPGSDAAARHPPTTLRLLPLRWGRDEAPESARGGIFSQEEARRPEGSWGAWDAEEHERPVEPLAPRAGRSCVPHLVKEQARMPPALGT